MQRLGNFVLVLIALLLIGTPALWKLRKLCELSQENCQPLGLFEFVLNDRLALAASVLVLLAMLTLIWGVIRAPGNSDEAEDDDVPEAKKFNLNGTVVVLIVCVAYLGASAALLMSMNLDTIIENPDALFAFSWKVMAPTYGSGFVYMALWHVNDYFVKPASNLLLAVLFVGTVGAVYMMQKSFVLGM